MNFEFKDVDGLTELWVDGVYFDTFDSVVDALEVCHDLTMLVRSPLTRDFASWLCRAEVQRRAAAAGGTRGA